MISKLDGYMAEKMGLAAHQLDRAAIEAWQLKQFNHLLSWCKAQSTYYTNYPTHVDRLADVAGLPFVTAQDIALRGDELCCVSQSQVSRVVTMQTSGTSGPAKRLYFSEADQQSTVDFFACGLSELNGPDDRCMILMPGHHPGGMSDLIARALKKIGAVPIHCGNDRTFAEMAALLDAQQVTTLVGSPVQILSLARYLQAYQLPHHIRAVLVSSDYLPEVVRKAIADTLHCAVYDHYGITEGGLGFSMECEQHTGLHIRENDLLVEIIDPDSGQPIPDGQWGEMVFTTLTRQAMPLIRYRTGDRARLLSQPCPCGSVVKRMDKIAGRLGQAQQRYTMPMLDEALFGLPEIVDAEAIYSASDHRLTVRLLLSEPLATVETIIRAVLQPILCQGDQLVLEAAFLDEANRQQAKSLYGAKRVVRMEE